MRYAVVHLKGGVGKTTVAAHLATHLARGHQTLLIDGDPQESAATWAAWRREDESRICPTTVRLRGKEILDEGERLQERYEHVVIDAGGRDGAGLRNTLLLAEKLIVPVGNSGLDVVGLDDLMERVEEARIFNPALEFRVLLNKINSSASTDELLQFLKEKGITLFTQMIRERRVYCKAMSEGLTADEFKPKNAAATHELKRFYIEVESWK